MRPVLLAVLILIVLPTAILHLVLAHATLAAPVHATLAAVLRALGPNVLLARVNQRAMKDVTLVVLAVVILLVLDLVEVHAALALAEALVLLDVEVRAKTRAEMHVKLDAKLLVM